MTKTRIGVLIAIMGGIISGYFTYWSYYQVGLIDDGGARYYGYYYAFFGLVIATAGFYLIVDGVYPRCKE